MAFGTGHHATTFMMIKQLMAMNLAEKEVLDAGCGTAILAVLAEKLKAAHVFAYDIDDWAVSNSQETVELNDCHKIDIEKGTIRTVAGLQKYDVIIANIERNILIDEMPKYVKYLKPSGFLLLSGFLKEDEGLLLAATEKENLAHQKTKDKDGWAMMVVKK